MIDGLRASASFTDKTYRRCKDTLSPLSCLYRSCKKAFACSDAFNGVDDGDGRIASEDEVAMHTMGKEDGISVLRGGLGDGQLGCREALGYDCSTVYSTSAGRMP